jgi:integrase
MGDFSIFAKWWADAGSRLGPDTVRQYRYYTHKALAEMGKDPTKLSRSELEKYLGSFKPQWAKQIRAGLFDFFAFLVRRGLRSSNPLEQVTVKTRRRKRVMRSLTRDELIRLLVAAVWVGKGGRRWTGEVQAWQYVVHYATGVRPGELVNLTRDRIELDGAASNLYIVDGKTGDRTVPIGRLANIALRELLGARKMGKPIDVGRTQYWELMRRTARTAGIDPAKCRPHALRHTFITHLRQAGVRWETVAELVGHSDIRQMSTYAGPEEDEKREAVDLLG